MTNVTKCVRIWFTISLQKGMILTMKWGTFGVVHITSLLLAVCAMVGLYFLLRRFSKRVQTLVLGVLSLSGIAAIIFNLLMWDSPWEYLPLHLCSLNAMLLPFAVFFRSKVLGNLLNLWNFGALLAVVLNHAQAEFTLDSPTFWFYFVPHVLEFSIPLFLLKLKLVEKDYRCIPTTLGLTVGMFTFVHLANKLLNSMFIAKGILGSDGEILQVNYMYTIVPENPVLIMLHNILPVEYWYLYLTLPLVILFLGIVYAPQLIRRFGRKK